MTEIARILFGVDESDFSRDSLAALGQLVAESPNLGISLFHGVPDPCIFLSKFVHLKEKDVEENFKEFHTESRHCVERAMKALIEAGVQKENAFAVLQEKCNDPAGSILDLAEAKGFDVIGAARFGASTIGRHPIGSVSYKLASSSEKFPVLIVDHRVHSRNFLVCLVGASIGEKIMDHVVRHFSHLTDSHFTLFHVISPLSLEAARVEKFMSNSIQDEKTLPMESMNLYVERTRKVMEEGKRKLVEAGIPEKNIELMKRPQDQGIARDILAELDRGDYGILVAGRKGSKDIKQFGLGSKAYKLLCAARAFMVCLVN
jgi:nucleotide-binding universal stress UspA family protein